MWHFSVFLPTKLHYARAWGGGDHLLSALLLGNAVVVRVVSCTVVNIPTKLCVSLYPLTEGTRVCLTISSNTINDDEVAIILEFISGSLPG